MKYIFQGMLLVLWLSSIVTSAYGASDRHTFLISDLHLGAGKEAPKLGGSTDWRRIEDFRWHEEFELFLQWASALGANKSDMVILGDSFELWQSPFMKCSSDPTNAGCDVPDCNEIDADAGCNETEALARFNHILSSHPRFVSALRNFAEAGSNHVHLVPGNHDAALLFKELQTSFNQAFKSQRITLSIEGYWLSGDGEVLGDHGHQFDGLNRYERWPTPFLDKKAEGPRLQKPWGENMVQQFYNQYEEVFPIIDNISEESDGIKFAVDQGGMFASAKAVGKFFRFFLFQQSIKQVVNFVGNDDPNAWDNESVRSESVDFFIEGLKVDAALRNVVEVAKSSKTLLFDPRALTDEEIEAVCRARRFAPPELKITPCPTRKGGNLGASLGAVIHGKEALFVDHLEAVLPKVKKAGRQYPSVYVFGHTHLAAQPTTLTVPNLPGGMLSLTYANTGAFQRVATPEQVKVILAKKRELNKSFSPFDLLPEDLPECYSFIHIKPYKDRPVPVLMSWRRGDSGKWMEAEGSCH